MKVRMTRVHGRLRRFWHLFQGACVSGYRDNVFGLAKGAAYSGLLAFFPVLTTVTAILVQANANAVSRKLSGLVYQAVPPGTERIVSWNFLEHGGRSLFFLSGTLLLSVWAASGLMMSLMEGFRAAYRIPNNRPFLKQRGVAAQLVFSSAIPLILASALLVFGARLERHLFERLGMIGDTYTLAPWLAFIAAVGRFSVAFFAIVASTCMLYYSGPNQKQTVRGVLPGAVVATSLWMIATSVFGWYVRNIVDYRFLYGSVGGVIALIVWMYLLSVIALIGCEYNAHRERVAGPLRLP
jgi:membrane protein